MFWPFQFREWGHITALPGKRHRASFLFNEVVIWNESINSVPFTAGCSCGMQSDVTEVTMQMASISTFFIAVIVTKISPLCMKCAQNAKKQTKTKKSFAAQIVLCRRWNGANILLSCCMSCELTPADANLLITPTSNVVILQEHPEVPLRTH